MTHIFEVPFNLSLVSTKHSENRLRSDYMRGYMVEPLIVGEVFVLAGSAMKEDGDFRYFHTSVVLNVEVVSNSYVIHTQNSVYRLAPCDPSVSITALDSSLDIEQVRRVYDVCIMAQDVGLMASAIEDLLVEEYRDSELIKDDAFVSALAARSQLWEQMFMHSLVMVAKERNSSEMLN